MTPEMFARNNKDVASLKRLGYKQFFYFRPQRRGERNIEYQRAQDHAWRYQRADWSVRKLAVQVMFEPCPPYLRQGMGPYPAGEHLAPRTQSDLEDMAAWARG